MKEYFKLNQISRNLSKHFMLPLIQCVRPIIIANINIIIIIVIIIMTCFHLLVLMIFK